METDYDEVQIEVGYDGEQGLYYAYCPACGGDIFLGSEQDCDDEGAAHADRHNNGVYED